MNSTTEHTEAINARILAVSEDKIQGFVREPFARIAELSSVGEPLDCEMRILLGVPSRAIEKVTFAWLPVRVLPATSYVYQAC